MASYSAIITSAEVIIAGGQMFKITASRFVNVSEEEMNLMKENAIPRNTKHATKFGMQMSYLYASDFPFKNFCKLW